LRWWAFEAENCLPAPSLLIAQIFILSQPLVNLITVDSNEAMADLTALIEFS